MSHNKILSDFMNKSKELSFTAAVVQEQLLAVFIEQLTNLNNVRLKAEQEKGKEFESDTEAAMITSETPLVILRKISERISIIYPTDKTASMEFIKYANELTNTEQLRQMNAILQDLYAICKLFHKYVLKFIPNINDDRIGLIPIKNESASLAKLNIIEYAGTERLKVVFDRKLQFDDYFSYADKVSVMLGEIRQENRQLTPEEYLAYHLANYEIKKDVTQLHKRNYRCLGTIGFRKYNQTYPALTDPGEGHVLGTMRKSSYLIGSTIHCEHLERPGNKPRDEIESYRIPSVQNFARLRLNVGDSAPTTFFLGRMLKDSGNFDQDFLKTVRTFAYTITCCFALGAAECKMAMDGLTTFEAVEVMRTLKAEVCKEAKQIMSAAWNINKTLVDDYYLNKKGEYERAPKDKVMHITDPFEIGKRAIVITRIGTFEKLTWDGAGDSYPSKCILPYQLRLSQGFELVHRAHEQGLLTYFSAGFKFREIKLPVFCGADALGIGGAQILRYMDKKTGFHGPFTEENIPKIQHERTTAEQSSYGKYVQLLCRLDLMYFEGSLTKSENESRIELYNTVHERYAKYDSNNQIDDYAILLEEKDEKIEELLNKLQRIIKLDNEEVLGEHPYLNKAKRLLATENIMLKEFADSEEEWSFFLTRLEKFVEVNDDSSLEEEARINPWLSLFSKYTKHHNQHMDYAPVYVIPINI